jgi:hypothetical protein
MPWNGSGVFARLYSWSADRDAGLDILADRMDTDTDDIAAGLMHCLTVNGETVPTANLPMANFRHTGASAGVANTDYCTVGQVKSGGGGLSGGFLPLSGGTLTGELTAAGLVSTGGVVATGNIQTNAGIVSGATLQATGHIDCFNGSVYCLNVECTGTVQGPYLYSTGNITASGNISATSGTVTAQQLTSTGGVTAAGTVTAANVSATSGTVTAQQLTSTGNVTASGNINATSGTVTAQQLTSTGNINATANATIGAALTVGGNAALHSFTTTTDSTVGGTLTVQHNGIKWGGFDPNNFIGMGWAIDAAGLNVWVNGVYEGTLAPAGSDLRRKTNLAPAARDALEVLSAVDLYAFDRLDAAGRLVAHHDVGFLAQQLRELIPEAVIAGPAEGDGEPLLSLDLMPLLAHAVRAIQQLTGRLAALETARS